MSIDEQHVALPKLYGAPAYARPAPHREDMPRPFDPDELPIEAVMTDDERDFAAGLPSRAFAPGGAYHGGTDSNGADANGLRPRAFSIKSLTAKIRGATKKPV